MGYSVIVAAMTTMKNFSSSRSDKCVGTPKNPFPTYIAVTQNSHNCLVLHCML